jgi:hypothetical protein
VGAPRGQGLRGRSGSSESGPCDGLAEAPSSILNARSKETTELDDLENRRGRRETARPG